MVRGVSHFSNKNHRNIRRTACLRWVLFTLEYVTGCPIRGGYQENKGCYINDLIRESDGDILYIQTLRLFNDSGGLRCHCEEC